MYIILGGTSGLGKEIAAQLRAHDKDVLVLGSSYNADKDGEGIVVDLADAQSVEKCVTLLQQQIDHQTIEAFWWVSGYGYNGDFSSQEHPERMAAVNFAGALPLVQFAWKKLLEQDRGTLAVVSSTTGERARADEAVYAGTKHAQVGFTRSLGLEAERIGTSAQVALFLPGGMRTPFWDANPPAAYDSFNDPAKVARKMIDVIKTQEDRYTEESIQRGELV